jgi:hypothetical protein
MNFKYHIKFLFFKFKHTLKADNPNAFTIGSVGFCDQDCDFLDYTYVQLNSNELNQRVNQEISLFVDGIKNSEVNKVNEFGEQIFI